MDPQGRDSQLDFSDNLNQNNHQYPYKEPA